MGHFAGVDLAIEAVFENLNLKGKIARQVMEEATLEHCNPEDATTMSFIEALALEDIIAIEVSFIKALVALFFGVWLAPEDVMAMTLAEAFASGLAWRASWTWPA